MVKITEIMDRTDSSESENESNNTILPLCRYGLSCYRKNPVHFTQFRHPQKVHSSSVSEEKVSVKIEIGHKATLKTEKKSEDLSTHLWTVYVQGAEKYRIEHFVEKVVFNLPQHYPFPIREFVEPPFSTSSEGYGSFVILIDIFFRNNVEPKKIRFTYDLYLNNTSFTNVRLEKMTFQNPNAEFRQLLLKAGGEILVNPDSSTSTSSEQPSTSAANKLKRKVSSENLVNTPNKSDEYETFGQHCALKLRKLEDLCPLQKVIAERLIADVFYHANLKSLSAESSILSRKNSEPEVKKEPVEVEEPPVAVHIKEEKD